MEERIKILIDKLKTLAERGEAGEAQVAKEKLELILGKYGLTLEELAKDTEESERTFYFNDKWEKRLIVQIVAYYLGKPGVRAAAKSMSAKEGTVVFSLTNELYIDITRTYEAAKEDLTKEMDIMFIAFVQKHNLGVTESNSSKGNLDSETLWKVLNMMSGLSTEGTPVSSRKKGDDTVKISHDIKKIAGS